jgi:archaeal flagellar protein FlaJ
MKLFSFFKNKDNNKKKTEGFDNELLEVDFFCQMAYMAAIATSGISRAGLFFRSAKLPYSATRYFRRVDFVAKMFNHDYAQACRIVGEKTKDSAIKALLLRLSGALASGEDISGFLSRESAILSESYGSGYERRLDTLRKWSDAYVSLILTTALVTVMSVVTMMIGNVTTTFMVSLAVLTIAATITGSWFLYHTAPRETKNHSFQIRSPEQDLARKLTRLCLPLGGLVVIFLLFIQVDFGMVLLAVSAFLFPIGLIALSDDRKVSKRDDDIAAFLRSLGGVMQAIGATATEAISRIDFRSLGILKEDVTLLHTRLLAGVTPDACWNSFIGETGSELINRSVRTFWDGITLGGEPQEVGNEASSFALKISLLRSQRSQIASGFIWLTVAMHAVLTMLSVFIYSVFTSFANLVKTLMPKEGLDSSVMSGLPSFGLFSTNSTQVSLLHFMVITIVVVLTLANAFAIYAVSGGHPRKLFFYLALTSAISGIVFLVVPPVASMMFHGIGA